jgi:hypothetical protein
MVKPKTKPKKTPPVDDSAEPTSAAVLLTVIPIGYTLVVLFRLPLTDKPLRVNWPQAEISERMTGIWARETQHPLRIVSGDAWIAGLG